VQLAVLAVLLWISHSPPPLPSPCRALQILLQSYKDSVLPPDVEARISFEAGSTFGWMKYTGTKGHNIGVDTFGASGPGPALYKEFGITVEALVDAAKKYL